MRIYLFELHTQGKFLEIGERELAVAVGGIENGVDEIWSAIHSILGAAANISKLLWGGDDAAYRDRKPLRDELGVSDDSPLKIRTVRNKFEHMDEYVDEFLRQDPGRTYVGRNVGGSVEQWQDKDAVFGHYNPESGRVWFWKWEVSLPEIIREGRTLGGLAWDRALAARWVD
jgi:hypothetical protein